MIENQVKIIQGEQIKALQIHPRQCIEWVEESFKAKGDVQLPTKNSVHPQAEDFFTSMPCLLPETYGRFGIKIVHRIQEANPTLGSDILLYDSQRGKLLAMIDGDWITGMRTGAVAALSVRLLKRSGNLPISIMGLGNTARATLLCLLADNPYQHLHIRLLAYKNQETLFMERFKDEKKLSFEVIKDPDTFFGEADIIISCITAAGGKLVCPNNELFKEGVLVVPVHTRGFQNCDLFFDHVFGDDYNHIAGFKYFQQFKHFEELGQVLMGKVLGRTNDKERILAYNVGIGLNDILFASKIYDLVSNTTTFVQQKESEKYWL